MASEQTSEIIPDTVVHRIGGGHIENLQLSALEKELVPPGISVLLGGTAPAAAQQMRNAFPKSRKWYDSVMQVGTATIKAIRAAGFEVIMDATTRFQNRARLVHPDGVAGFTDANLERLAHVFEDMVES